MASIQDYVQNQLVYWAQINADGTIAVQQGPGALTVTVALSVYTITLPANYTIPVARRMVDLTPANGASSNFVIYDRAGSAYNTVIVRGYDVAGAAANCAFEIGIYRINLLP